MSKAAELAALIANVNKGSSLGSKNFIINGAMNVSQRSVSETGLTSSDYRTIDRFRFSIGTAGTWTMSQSTDVPTGYGFANSLKLDCTTANASLSAGSDMSLQYKLEGQDVQTLRKGTSSAVPVTLSFWVKSTKTGTFICELHDLDNSRNISQAYTVSSSDTWEKKELTFVGDTTGALNDDNGESLRVQFHLVAGTTYTSGTLATSWVSPTSANRMVGQVNIADSTSNNWLLTGVQLEIGEKATEFEHEPFETTLNKCYRYYFRMEGQDINGGKIATHYRKRSGTGYFYNDTAFLAHYVLPVPMRIAPTALEQSGTDSDIDVAYRGTVSTPSGGVVVFNDATNHYFTTYHPNHSDNNATGEFGMQRIRQAAGLLAVSAEL